MSRQYPTFDPPHPSRRTFVRGLATGGVVAATGALRWPAVAWGLPQPLAPVQPQAVLRGQEFDLEIGHGRVNFTGAERTAITINGSLPAPLLHWREGDIVTMRVRNTLDETASIHWHGLVLPANMDGVPGLSFDGIPAGGGYTYRFPVRQAGTYWYHSHSGFQEQQGLYGPIVIHPRDPDPVSYDREHVLLLTDWTDEEPRRVFRKLKKDSAYYNWRQRTLVDLVRDLRDKGWSETMADRLAWGQMRMSASDLADVTGSTYTYLLNGTAPAGNWTGLFTPGERVRLRVINGSAMSYFDVRIPGLKLTVVAADGMPVRPVTVDEFRIAVAETYDVIVEPSGQDAYTIVAQAMDRTGMACGTLAVRAGLRAAVPALDSRPVLTVDDMGHGGHRGPGRTPNAERRTQIRNTGAQERRNTGSTAQKRTPNVERRTQTHAATRAGRRTRSDAKTERGTSNAERRPHAGHAMPGPDANAERTTRERRRARRARGDGDAGASRERAGQSARGHADDDAHVAP